MHSIICISITLFSSNIHVCIWGRRPVKLLKPAFFLFPCICLNVNRIMINFIIIFILYKIISIDLGPADKQSKQDKAANTQVQGLQSIKKKQRPPTLLSLCHYQPPRTCTESWFQRSRGVKFQMMMMTPIWNNNTCYDLAMEKQNCTTKT